MNLFENPEGIQTRWSSFENIEAKKACAGLENKGAKGHALDHLAAGETKTLLDVEGSGCRLTIAVRKCSGVCELT